MSMEDTIPKIKCTDIKAGDIVLFHGTDGGIEGLIRKLTLSDVSHAAICVEEGSSICVTEETKGGIQKNSVGDDMGFRQYAFVKRLNGENNLTPVLSRADYYLSQKSPFAYTQLPLLLLILLFRKIPLTSKTKSHLYKICEGITSKIIESLNNKIYGDKTVMVCSELVYVCYCDAANETGNNNYMLDVGSEFKTSGVSSSLFSQVKDYYRSNSDTIIHQTPEPKFLFNTATKEEDLDSLCDEFTKELDGIDVDGDNNLHEAIDDELMLLVHKIGFTMHKLFFSHNNFINRSDLPLSLAALENIERYLVTPEDLLNRCNNTTIIGRVGN